MLNRPRCNLCMRNHPVKYCRTFLSLSVERRRAYIVRMGYCLNCFAQTHNRNSCESPHRCGTCEAKHHTLLHNPQNPTINPLSSSYEEEEEPLAQEELVNVQPDPQQNDEASAPAKTTREVPFQYPAVGIQVPTDLSPQELVELELPEHPTPINPNHIPPIIRVCLYHNKNPMWVNFLLDQSAKISFLLRRVANIFPDFQTTTSSTGLHYGTFQVAPAFEGASNKPLTQWNLRICNDVRFTLPPPIDDPWLRGHFRSLRPLAHPNFDTFRDVDGVLGQKTLKEIMTKQVIQPYPDNPRARKSIFGWDICGDWNGCRCKTHTGPGGC